MTWGLALSGGAAYGLANAGILTVLEREGLKPNYISGSSMGAIVGALFALKGTTEFFAELTNSLTVRNVARWSDDPLKGGHLHGGIFSQELKKHVYDIVGEATVGDCAIPFVCIAGRVKKPIIWHKILLPGFADIVMECIEPVVFDAHTRLLDALMASSAIPVIFSPVKIGDREYIDLVHFGAIPARTLRSIHHPDILIGTNTAPDYTDLMKFLPKGWSEFLGRGYQELDKSIAACDLVIAPHLTHSPLRFDKASAFVKAGEVAALRSIQQLRSFIK